MSSNVKKLLIIGNGFDLSCGLASSFGDYFNMVIPNIKSEVLAIHKFLNYIKGEDIKNDFEVNTVGYKSATKHFWTYDIHLNDNKCDCYNFWNYYFEFIKKSDDKNNNKFDKYNWCDVESQIQKLCYIINNISNKDVLNNVITDMAKQESKKRVYNSIRDLCDFKCINSRKLTSNNKDKFNYYRRIIKYVVLVSICFCNFSKFYSNCYRIDSIHTLYDFLFHELFKFETCFQKYIKKCLITNKHKNNSIYFSRSKLLLKELVGNDDYHLITFNYTGEMNNGHCKEYLPIHSDIDHHPIIGIDDYKSENAPYFEFSKLFRIMSSKSDISINDLVPNSINEIIFYGHSLSGADYPYFKYIFDKVGINRDSNVTLKFCYTEYSKNVDEKHNQMINVYNLLNDYENSDGLNDLRIKLIMERKLRIISVKDPKEIINNNEKS